MSRNLKLMQSTTGVTSKIITEEITQQAGADTRLHEGVTEDHPAITKEHHQQIKAGAHSEEIVVTKIIEEAKTKTRVKTMTKKIADIVKNQVTLLKNALNSKPKKPQWR